VLESEKECARIFMQGQNKRYHSSQPKHPSDTPSHPPHAHTNTNTNVHNNTHTHTHTHRHTQTHTDTHRHTQPRAKNTHATNAVFEEPGGIWSIGAREFGKSEDLTRGQWADSQRRAFCAYMCARVLTDRTDRITEALYIYLSEPPRSQ